MDGNHELKKNINNSIKESSDIVKRIKMTLKDKKAPETIMAIMKYHENDGRFHRTTLMLLVAVEQNKPKSTLESIIKKRLEYMSIAMELFPYLVEHGLIREQHYLQLCKDFKQEYQVLQADLEDY